MSILKIQNLTKKYKNRILVENINLHIKSHEVIGLLGPNGAGKTTTFYMIIGIITPDLGTISINNTNISHLPLYSRAKKGIGYLPQESSIFRKLSVYNNLLSVLEYQKFLSYDKKKIYAKYLMKKFDIYHLKNHMGYELSGGERRRVEIARALSVKPKFILFDEPFSGIDPISIENIKIIISFLQKKGLGILITDHNVRETLSVCTRAYIVNKGKIIAFGTPLEILKNKNAKKFYLGNSFSII